MHKDFYAGSDPSDSMVPPPLVAIGASQTTTAQDPRPEVQRAIYEDEFRRAQKTLAAMNANHDEAAQDDEIIDDLRGDNPPRCKACGERDGDHIGQEGLCYQLQAAQAEIARLKRLVAEQLGDEAAALFEQFHQAKAEYFATGDEDKVADCHRIAAAVYRLQDEYASYLMSVEERQLARQRAMKQRESSE